MKAISFWAISLISVFLTVIHASIFLSVAHASDRCDCDFRNSEYSAFGTRAACTAITRGKECEVRFAATTFNKELVQQVVPDVDYELFRDSGFELTFRYLDALRGNYLVELLNDQGFLSEAIPFFLRSAYLGSDKPLVPISDLKALDQNIVEYFKGNVSKVQQIFAAESKPDTEEVGGTTFEIGKGYIVVTSKDLDLKIVNVLFSETN